MQRKEQSFLQPALVRSGWPWLFAADLDETSHPGETWWTREIKISALLTWHQLVCPVLGAAAAATCNGRAHTGYQADRWFFFLFLAWLLAWSILRRPSSHRIGPHVWAHYKWEKAHERERGFLFFFVMKAFEALNLLWAWHTCTRAQGRHDFTGLRSLHTAHDKLRAPFASLAECRWATASRARRRWWAVDMPARRQATSRPTDLLCASVGIQQSRAQAVCAGVVASGRNPEGTLAGCDHVYQEHIGRKYLFWN